MNLRMLFKDSIEDNVLQSRKIAKLVKKRGCNTKSRYLFIKVFLNDQFEFFSHVSMADFIKHLP